MKIVKNLVTLIVLVFITINCGNINNSKKRELSKKDFLIKSEAIGKSSIGSSIETMKDSLVCWNFENKIETVSEEGETYEEKSVAVSDTNETLLKIKIGELDGNEVIQEIKIISEKFETERGISVGSAIADFMHKYRDFKIWYSYVSDIYVIESASLARVQFILDPAGCLVQVNANSDMEILNPIDFSPGTKITEIRIY